MTDKDQEIHPTSQANGHTKHDEETAVLHSKEARKKKRMKCLLYIAIFVVFQTAIILLFALTVMKIRTPKFRVQSATFDTFNFSSNTNPSFNISMNAEVGVKNTNFGHYKFRDSTINFFYNDLFIADAFVPEARARACSTKKFNIFLNLSLSNVPQLGSDLDSGVLSLKSKSTMNGKVELFKVLKKKKSTEMDCILAINLRQELIGDLRCK
ncbi:late embryogenesis abundant At1g64065-like [Olea europaea subsp. europaea]|uniref:Late embryogenesis abundant At1g64065-like n=1 Tax=Olea europaea subsp. europaea TaxID=158383 RepID=A0A8S0PV07_OLEEU|nr:late embryogenesis abundant At1g64065-like [Olea europaea subsp. europaea]